MASRRSSTQRRMSWEYGDSSIVIRVGSRRNAKRFNEIVVNSSRDASHFMRLIEAQVLSAPRDPLIISVNGYQPWLEEVLSACIKDFWADISELDREVQFAGTMQFPERASTRGGTVPWTFIIDHMNVPQVYSWSVGLHPPRYSEGGDLPDIDHYRFRIGVWECGKGACRLDRDIPVVIVFTKPDLLSEHVVTELLFGFLYKDKDLSQPRGDEEGICWVFARLYWLLSDWPNIVAETVARLDDAEANSYGRHLPVKWRTRMLHNQVDRLYELKEYLHFHLRSFRKLQRLKALVPREEHDDPLWNDMDDAAEDLEQYESSLDSLKERFNNLVELEFNIQNAVQSDSAQFLSVIATLFLPLSYLASLWGFSSVTWTPMEYVYAAVPLFVISAMLTLVVPWSVRKVQRFLYPIERMRKHSQPGNFTMLGDALPESVDVPGRQRQSRRKHKAQRPAGLDGTRSRSASRRRVYDDDD